MDEKLRKELAKPMHGDHSPGDKLPEGGKCLLKWSVEDGVAFSEWTCGWEDSWLRKPVV